MLLLYLYCNTFRKFIKMLYLTTNSISGSNDDVTAQKFPDSKFQGFEVNYNSPKNVEKTF